MPDIDYYAAFGLEKPADTKTETEPDNTGTETEKPVETDESVETVETAESVEPEESPASEPEEPHAEPENKPEQSKEERARQAAARRKREQDAALEKVRQEELEKQKIQWAEFFKNSGIRNEETGEAFTSKEEYDAYQTAQKSKKAELETAAREKRFKEGKVTSDDVKAVVSDMPEIQAAKEAVKKAQEETRKTQDERAKTVTQQQIEEINKLDPDSGVKSVQDLLTMDNADIFREYVRKGLSFVEAYKLANSDKLLSTVQKLAKQEAANLANSKSHLISSQAKGKGDVLIPMETKAMYKALFPELSDKDFSEDYSKRHKKKG